MRRLAVLKAWEKLKTIYALIMTRNGRLESNYRLYPIETFDKVFTYIMVRLPREIGREFIKDPDIKIG